MTAESLTTTAGEGSSRGSVLWLAVVLMIASWPVWRLGIAVGLDPSWNTGLVLAHVERLRFGREVAYTYGPLGFLVTPLAISPSSLVGAICYAALGGFTLAYATITACVRRFGSRIGLIAASILMVTAPLEIFAPELYSLGFVLLACLVAQRELQVPRVPFIAAVGVAAAIQTLIKPTAAAIAVIALVIAMTTSRRRVRGLGAGAAGYFVGVLGFWFVAGQSPADIVDWARLTLGFSAGYADAMMGEESGRLFEYLAAPVLVVAVVAYAYRNTVPIPDRRSSVFRIVLLSAAYWIVAKEGFVRHDLHSTIAFFGIGIIGLAIEPRVRKPRLLGGILAASVIMTSIATLAPLSATLDPTASLKTFLSALTLVARPSERARVNTAADAQARVQYGVPSEFLSRIGDSGVHVDPAETSLVQAYALTWKPVPVFQRFQAYTERADTLNASVLAGPRGPPWILREGVPAVDGRNDLWDSPRYVLQMICRYAQLSANVRWQLLERKGNRCGAEAVIGRATAEAGEDVTVPPPRYEGSIVIARIRTQVSFLDRVMGTVFKPRHPLMLTADGVSYRVAQSPDSGPIVVRIPRSVSWDPAFGGMTNYRSLRTNRPASFEFVEIPVRRVE